MPRQFKAPDDPHSVDQILEGGSLSRLMRGAQYRLQIQQLLTEVIPDPVLSHITYYNLTNQILTLGVQSPSWATRLRAMTSDLLYALERKRSLERVREVRIILKPASTSKQSPPERTHKPPQTPSTESIESVQELADYCGNDLLQKALKQLAKSMQSYQKGKG